MNGGVFALPDLGEGLTEAEIIEWMVAVGDTVEVDQVVVVVETAKASVEVPVPFAGVVAAIHAEAGAVVAVGEPLLSVGAERSAADASGNVLIGYGTSHSPVPRRRRLRSVPHTSPDPQSVEDAAPVAPPAARVISPLVRRQAADHGIDVATIVPSGRGGVVVRRDVEAAIADRASATGVVRDAEAAKAGRATAGDGLVGRDAEAAQARRATGGDGLILAGADAEAGYVGGANGGAGAGGPDGERIPIRGTRRVIAEKMSRSRTEIPEVTTWVDADATGLLAARDALRSAGWTVSVLALVARICVAGLARFGELNASVDMERAEIVRRRDIHLGFAAQTDHGLLVPVVHDAHQLTTAQLATELSRLTELARSGRLQRHDLTGGTFTLNNYGVFGVDGSTPIINHPEAALLGMGRIADKAWVHDGAVAVRKVVQLSLTFDHRVCDGASAGGYLRFVADAVENPVLVLADL